MKKIVNDIKEEIAELDEALKNLKKRNAVTSNYKVVVRNGGKNPLYYLKDSTGKEKYIRSEDLTSVAQILQGEYDLKAISMIQKRIKELMRINKILNETDIEKYYENLSIGRRKFIKPVFESMDSFVEKWKKDNLTGLNILGTGFDTKAGFKVRSKSEKIIADLLVDNGITFAYEKTIRLKNGRTFSPDFTIMDAKNKRTIYWEHFGMMNSIKYVEQTINKLSNYYNHGMIPGTNFIWTSESNNNFSVKEINNNINWILKGGKWNGTPIFEEETMVNFPYKNDEIY